MSNQQYYKLWEKYLKVIHVQMKNAKSQAQEIGMSKKEFEVYGRRPVSDYVFNLEIIKGKASETAIGGSAVARDLFDILRGDENIRPLLQRTHYKINLGKEFILKIQLIETFDEHQ